VLDPKHAAQAKNGIFDPPPVMHGKIAGIWKRTLRKADILIEATWFNSFTKRQGNSFNKAAKCYGEFIGLPVVVMQH
jgi:hypothetical protein